MHSYLSASVGTLLPHQVPKLLDRRIEEILEDVKRSPVWEAVMGSGTDPIIAQNVLKEIYLEIVMYQPDAIEGAIAAIAQFPRTMPVAWFDEMLHHQVEEFDHGEMALRDFVSMGGNEESARKMPKSPTAFAVSAVWNEIARKRNPFNYLGAVYLFDALTPIITGLVKESFARRDISSRGHEFIVHHATADIEHADMIAQLITDVLGKYPEKTESVLYGFEYFAQVYPVPVWNAAHLRAIADPPQHVAAAE